MFRCGCLPYNLDWHEISRNPPQKPIWIRSSPLFFVYSIFTTLISGLLAPAGRPKGQLALLLSKLAPSNHNFLEYTEKKGSNFRLYAILHTRGWSQDSLSRTCVSDFLTFYLQKFLSVCVFPLLCCSPLKIENFHDLSTTMLSMMILTSIHPRLFRAHRSDHTCAKPIQKIEESIYHINQNFTNFSISKTYFSQNSH